jgi:hypothetical protein
LLRYTFNTACKGVGRCADKYVKIDLKHIFTMGLRWNKKGVLTNIKGLHHDLGNFIEKSGEIIFTSKEMFTDGFYKAHLCLKGQTHKIIKTFFPAHWSRKQVAEATIEAYNAGKNAGKVIYQKNGTYLIEGMTKSGIKIQIYLSESGKITTTYPML